MKYWIVFLGHTPRRSKFTRQNTIACVWFLLYIALRFQVRALFSKLFIKIGGGGTYNFMLPYWLNYAHIDDREGSPPLKITFHLWPIKKHDNVVLALPYHVRHLVVYKVNFTLKNTKGHNCIDWMLKYLNTKILCMCSHCC